MTDRDPAYRDLLDAEGTKAAAFAEQIVATTRPFLPKPVEQLDVLDLGCGYGHTSRELARRCRSVVGIEPSETLSKWAAEKARASGLTNVTFRRAGVDDLNESGAYDLIVLDNVFEHLPQHAHALRRMVQALRPGGVLYLLTPNKLWPIEAHYRLPLLAYLPLPMANAYLRLTGRGTDYTDASYAPTYGRLRKLLAEAGLRYDFVVPADLSLTDGGMAAHYRLGAALIRRFPSLWRFSKGFLVIARKAER